MVMDYYIQDIFGHGKNRVSMNKHRRIFVVVSGNTRLRIDCTKIKIRRREKTPSNAFIIIHSNRLYCFQIYYFEIWGVTGGCGNLGSHPKKKLKRKVSSRIKGKS